MPRADYINLVLENSQEMLMIFVVYLIALSLRGISKNSIDKERLLFYILYAYVIAYTLAIIYSYFAYTQNDPLNSVGLELYFNAPESLTFTHGGKLRSTIISYGLTVVSTVVIFILFSYNSFRDRGFKYIELSILMLIGIFAIYLTLQMGRRITALVLILTTLYFAINKYWGTIRHIKAKHFLIYALVLLLLLAGYYLFSDIYIIKKIAKQGLADGRVEWWLPGLQYMLDYPFGGAASIFINGRYPHAHNTWIDIGKWYGVGAFAFLLLFTLMHIKYFIQIVRNTKISSFMKSMIVILSLAVFSNWIIEPVFHTQRTYFFYSIFFLGFLKAYSDLYNNSSDKTFNNPPFLQKIKHKVTKRKRRYKKDLLTNRKTNGSSLPLNISQNEKPKYEKLLQLKYILIVNMEQSENGYKNIQKLSKELLDRYDDISLIVLGRNDLDTLKDNRVYYIDNLTDEKLDLFIKNAYITVSLSLTSRHVVQIEKSLSFGNVVIVPLDDNIYEVGQKSVDYLRYGSYNELNEAICCYLDNDNLYQKKKNFISEKYQISRPLVENRSDIKHNLEVAKPKKLQFVFISIDLQNLKGTITAIDKYIDFVDSYLIITSENMISGFQSLKSKHNISIINENEILDENIDDFKKRDHQTKNWILRASLLKIEALHDRFIMLDDDNRPLKKIEIEHFIDEGKYKAYYYYDLAKWHSYTSEYDLGQHRTEETLRRDGLELLSYSSHKPQIIDKAIFSEVVERYYELGLTIPIDEWSIYFNYAASKYPHLFRKIKFDVLNWPDHPSKWEWLYRPDEYNFENYYEQLYGDNLFGNHKNMSLEDKIILKENQLKPYLQTKSFFDALKIFYKDDNIVHGVMEFKQDEKSIYCYGLPYYLEIAQGSWLKLPFNYKAVSMTGINELQLLYYIDKKIGFFSNIYIDNSDYFESTTYLNISGEHLKKGLYDLLIDIDIDGNGVYRLASPYLIKLRIK